jgi:D-glycero-D-manno-heptose 1,7-bisphosphate phosphatase
VSDAAGRPAVFLDRDGVVNDMWYDRDHGRLDSPRRPSHLRRADGAVEGMRLLRRQGWPLVIVSNQPGLAKGTLTAAALSRLTDVLVRRLDEQGVRLAALYYCPHHPAGRRRSLRVGCDCRKPAPGLILRAARDLGLDPRSSWMVGDGVNDVVAGHRAGCRTVWIGRWKCENCQAFAAAGVPAPARAADLHEAARYITAQRRDDATVP